MVTTYPITTEKHAATVSHNDVHHVKGYARITNIFQNCFNLEAFILITNLFLYHKRVPALKFYDKTEVFKLLLGFKFDSFKCCVICNLDRLCSFIITVDFECCLILQDTVGVTRIKLATYT
ncbi:hypothetical protein BD770DRAFT_424898 [Pilaira anomala]|nr:hypothetical protein BD770DRAFT_424898 [Pilaira anomala]